MLQLIRSALCNNYNKIEGNSYHNWFKQNKRNILCIIFVRENVKLFIHIKSENISKTNFSISYLITEELITKLLKIHQPTLWVFFQINIYRGLNLWLKATKASHLRSVYFRVYYYGVKLSVIVYIIKAT